ncbi:MAG: hypothetical protein Q9201_000285 [Fulgogasparrea decipioides]
MKERISFIQTSTIDRIRESFEAGEDYLSIKALKAAREQRLTIFNDTPSTLRYYELLPALEEFVTYIRQKICPKLDSRCLKESERLLKADYIDIDYDKASQSLVLTVFHHDSPRFNFWNEQIRLNHTVRKIDIGVFSNTKATDSSELALEGHLTVPGGDKQLKQTQFSFPSRHLPVPPISGTTFHTTFPRPTGLHPTLRLTFPSAISPPAPACALHTYLTLPSSLFVDKYQLSSPNFLASKNLRALRSLSGETDLETPNWMVQKWGSTVLLELSPPISKKLRLKQSNTPWHADVPLHLRYLSPALGGISDVDVPWPVVFWTCPAEEGTKLDGNPFDRVNLGYDELFDPQTVFYHLQPQPEITGRRLVERLQVPVMDLEGTRWVESGTVGVVVLGAVWVIWKLLRIMLRDWSLGNRIKEEEKKLQ